MPKRDGEGRKKGSAKTAAKPATPKKHDQERELGEANRLASVQLDSAAHDSPKPQSLASKGNGEPFDYSTITPITTYIPPQKQAAKRHYGSHQYFTKRAWNVIQEYIKRFTQPGDVVCDPYGGSGTTVIEAAVLGRRGIYLDISEWAKFLAQGIAVAPVSLAALEVAFDKLEKACKDKMEKWVAMSDTEVAKVPITRWYPKRYPLPQNADVALVEELFTHRQLLCLSELHHHIDRIKEPIERELMRMAFSATLYMCNRTFISAKKRLASRGGSSIFSIYRYKVAKRTVELNPWDVFAKRLGSIVVAKKETNKLIGPQPDEVRNVKFIQGYAQRLTDFVAPESVDYIFTDPPYGSHISYLDLTTMWNAWLGFEVKPEDKKEETIEGGDEKHTPEHFKETLTAGIAEVFKVLKYDRWMSLVFAHREPAMWDTIVKAAEGAGFEYVSTVAQPVSVIWSMHKKKNPLTVLSGELILTFRKVRNPRTLAITKVGYDTVSLIKDSAELSIVQDDGATTDKIYSDLIPKLLENGLLGEVSDKIGDVTPVLKGEFNYDADNKTWHIRPGRKLGSHIPLENRIRFYVTDYLNQAERTGVNATIDDIVYHVLPKLKNGPQPTEQTLVSEIRKIAVPHQGKYWVKYDNPQGAFDFTQEAPVGGKAPPSNLKAEYEYEHNEVLWELATLARSVGLSVHIGKKEQTTQWRGANFAELSEKTLPFLRGAEPFTRDAVSQIDLIWLEAKLPQFAFEIEHSTAITTGIDRFIELLKVAPSVAERVIIVAPQSRRKKLDKILSKSHYIGAPMYMEAKVRYLWYSDVAKIVHRFATEQPTKATLTEAIQAALHNPKVRPT